MINDQEIERIANAIPAEVKEGCTTFLLGERYGSVFWRIQRGMATVLINEGIGDKKQAVKEFKKRLLSECEKNVVYAEWNDKHGEYGGDMVGIGTIETILNELFIELYGAEE